jgi:shikimate kinase
MREQNAINNDLDLCDQKILDLLKQRLGYVEEITEYKKAHDLPILQPEQEKTRLENLISAIGDYPYVAVLQEVFQQIDVAGKRVESKNLFDFNIALIGFMGAGKSTVSGYLKEMLAMDEVDVDSVIVKDQNMLIKDIFAEYGEEYFRNCESKAIIELQSCRQTLISCGGGAVMREENVANLKKTSRIVLLTASPETVLERVKGSDERPILNGNMNVEFITGLMEKRAELYRKAADVIIETDHKSVDQVCEELLKALLKLDR